MFRDIVQRGMQPNLFSVAISKVVSKSEDDSMLRFLFSVDSRTGLPQSDIGVFLNKQTNPSVKQYIEANLLSPNTPSNFATDDMIEDSIIDGTPSRYESIKDFDARVTAQLEAEKKEKVSKAARKKVREALRKAGLSDDEFK